MTTRAIRLFRTTRATSGSATVAGVTLKRKEIVIVSSLLSLHAWRGAVFAALLGGLAERADADGLQPLDTFIASANRQNPDNHVAEATADQAAAQRDAARASYLPTCRRRASIPAISSRPCSRCRRPRRS
jgi:hypothetical protein